ncbi:hypothetical protein [Streptomyces sp. S.PNR 29]|uniref:hypothetical protein n=1 Tax=Streptomyces sp. S.PNR 29 TaxID=2973805 RepID=UPI0025B24FB6|nr:hypothetical protein [Streptomyces sp. S.PNR 29]MDN0198314.1 hypothetical protein [Streptomyces sp. S.PNR 29]
MDEAPGARRRTVALAGAAIAAVLPSAALVVNLLPGDGDDDGVRGGRLSVEAAVSRSAGESTGASKSADAKGESAAPSATSGGGSASGATAPTVSVNPYKWESPCSQHYLINRRSEHVPPQPPEQEARAWVTALGGVAAGQQMLALTVQGTGKATVVLEDLYVRRAEQAARAPASGLPASPSPTD